MCEPSASYARRNFLKLAALASPLALGGLAAAQKQRKFPEPPAGSNPGMVPPGTDGQSAQRAQLKLNEKEFRESLEHLYDRVSELKQDTDAMHTSDIFSLKVYKQTGEIEHLAKKLRSLAKT